MKRWNNVNRYYSSFTGRFTTPDPYRASAGSENPQSWNRYTYVLGDPVSTNDPSGLDPYCGPNKAWMGEGCTDAGIGLSVSNIPMPGAYNTYGVGPNGQWVNTGSWMGVSSPDIEAGLAAYVESVDLAPVAGNAPCEQGVVRDVIVGDANNLGVTLQGYTLDHVSVAGLTNKGADTMTELYLNVGSPSAWTTLVGQLTVAGFVAAGYDPLHGVYDHSYRQRTADGSWSMQVSYDSSHNLQIDIDPHNPKQNLPGHALDVIVNTLTGLDTNYHTAGSNLGINVAPCH